MLRVYHPAFTQLGATISDLRREYIPQAQQYVRLVQRNDYHSAIQNCLNDWASGARRENWAASIPVVCSSHSTASSCDPREESFFPPPYHADRVCTIAEQWCSYNAAQRSYRNQSTTYRDRESMIS